MECLVVKMQYKNRNRTFCKAWNRLQRYSQGVVPICRARIGLKHFQKAIEKVWDARDARDARTRVRIVQGTYKDHPYRVGWCNCAKMHARRYFSFGGETGKGGRVSKRIFALNLCVYRYHSKKLNMEHIQKKLEEEAKHFHSLLPSTCMYLYMLNDF